MFRFTRLGIRTSRTGIPRRLPQINLRHLHLSNVRLARLTPLEIAATKARLLATALNPIARTLLRVRWALIRDGSRLSALDATSAFLSSFVMANLLWIVLGTTTFVLAVAKIVNYIDEWLSDDQSAVKQKSQGVSGYVVGSILLHGLGVKLLLAPGAALPKFVDGKLRLLNVSVSLRPGLLFTTESSIDQLDVSLSFNKWYEGGGLISEVEILGLSGFVKPLGNSVLIESSDLVSCTSQKSDAVKSKHQNSELEPSSKQPSMLNLLLPQYRLDHVKIRDSRLDIYTTTDSETPIRVSIFGCELPQLHASRALLDILNASNASGTVNGAMFTIHERQDSDVTAANAAKTIRFKLADIDLASIANEESKFNWISGGHADITADITLPADAAKNDESQITSQYWRIVHNVSSAIDTLRQPQTATNTAEAEAIPGFLSKGALSAIYHTFSNAQQTQEHSSKYVLVDAQIKFRNLLARMPLLLPHSADGVPFISLPDLRSFIAHINHASANHSNVSSIVVNSSVIEKLSDLSNVDSFSQSNMMDSIVSDVYRELLAVAKVGERKIKERNSLTWSHILASQLLLLGLGVFV